jgi:hypothetical protein
MFQGTMPAFWRFETHSSPLLFSVFSVSTSRTGRIRQELPTIDIVYVMIPVGNQSKNTRTRKKLPNFMARRYIFATDRVDSAAAEGFFVSSAIMSAKSRRKTEPLIVRWI